MASIRVAPQSMLLYTALGAMFVVFLNVYLAVQIPWLGLEFQPETNGLRVASVGEKHPNRNVLSGGELITGFRNQHGQLILVSGQTIIEEPDVLDSNVTYNQFMQRQTALVRLLHNAPIQAVLGTEDQVVLQTIEYRPLVSLPFPYWSQLLFGSMALLIGIGVWGFSRQVEAARLLALVGACLFVQLHVAGYYGARELAIHGDWFRALSVINHAGASYMIASFTGLLWIYPQRLGALPMVGLLFVAATLVVLLSALQALPAPYLAVYSMVIVGVAAAWLFVVLQYRRARNMPVERAALSWFVLLVLISSGVFTAFIIIPVLLGKQPYAPQWLMYLTACVFHLGLALAITRYRLFELEQWWFRAWAWFFSGIAVIAVDLVLFWGFGLRQALSVPVSLAIIGWLYFPIRQRIWERLHPGATQRVESVLPGFASRLFAADSMEQIRKEWKAILQEMFAPLETAQERGAREAISVSNDGTVLSVPALKAGKHLQLRYPDAGARLYRPQDLELVQVLLEFAQRAATALQARNEGAMQERGRIMRDLHDDLGAKLLTLVYSTNEKETKNLGKSALQDLRTVISALSGEGCSLGRAAQQWSQEFEQRLTSSGIEHQCSIQHPLPDVRIDARTRINLSRILREAVSNAIKHGQARQVTLTGQYLPESGLKLCIEDDGRGFDTADSNRTHAGKGMESMRLRAGDINASLVWDTRPGQGCRVSITMPLHE